MKLEYVLELVKAGFDKDEIMKMVDGGEEVTPEEKPEEKPEESEEKPEESKPEEKTEQKQDPYAAYVQAMQKTMDEMRETLKKIQAANVRGTELPENKDEPADILGKAIF